MDNVRVDPNHARFIIKNYTDLRKWMWKQSNKIAKKKGYFRHEGDRITNIEYVEAFYGEDMIHITITSIAETRRYYDISFEALWDDDL